MALSGDAVSFRGGIERWCRGGRRFTGLRGFASSRHPGQSFDERVFFSAAVFAQIGVFDASYRGGGRPRIHAAIGLQRLAVRADIEVGLSISDSSGFDDIRRQRGNMQTIVSEHNRMTADYLRKPALSKRARSS